MPAHQGTCKVPTNYGKVFEGNTFNPVLEVTLKSSEAYVDAETSELMNIERLVSCALDCTNKDELLADDLISMSFNDERTVQVTALIPSAMGKGYYKVCVEDALGYREIIFKDEEGNNLGHIYLSEFPTFEKGKLYSINGVTFAAIRDFHYLYALEGNLTREDVVGHFDSIGCAVKLCKSHAKAFKVGIYNKVITEVR